MGARAKHAGGRPRKEIDLEELKRLLEEGRSLRHTADKLEVGVGTVRRAFRAISDSPAPEAGDAADDALAACQNYAKTY